jgi:hypothetical protein
VHVAGRWLVNPSASLVSKLARTASSSTDAPTLRLLDRPHARCWGPLDGREIDVEVNEDGQPPQQVAEAWLWLACGSELLEEDLGGRFGLEPVAGFGPPWLYVWIERHSPLGSQAPTAVNP